MNPRYRAERSANIIAMAWLLAACSGDDSAAGSKTSATGSGGDTNVTSGAGGEQVSSVGAGGGGTGLTAGSGGAGESGGVANGTGGSANSDQSDAAVHDATADNSIRAATISARVARGRPPIRRSQGRRDRLRGTRRTGGWRRRRRRRHAALQNDKAEGLGKRRALPSVITWGNGYGDNPPTYLQLLNQLASHGFVVIASLNHSCSIGDPPPMRVCWHGVGDLPERRSHEPLVQAHRHEAHRRHRALRRRLRPPSSAPIRASARSRRSAARHQPKLARPCAAHVRRHGYGRHLPQDAVRL